MTATTMFMVDRAAHWYQSFKLEHSCMSWDQLKSAVLKEFEVNTHREKVM